MSLAEFKASPWAKSHPAYRGGAIAMSPAPEYANSEVLVASLYRTIGSFDGAVPSISEGLVPVRGRELERTIVQRRDRGGAGPHDGAALDEDGVLALLHTVLESPKLPNQSTKRFLQVTPLVGETASFSGSARLAGNPWPAGALVRQMVWMGSPDDAAARATWSGLYAGLGVHDDDDVFARFLRSELSAWSGAPWGSALGFPGPDDAACLPAGELDGFASPARQFCLDLGAVLEAKSVMTRRQWTSLLEALVRIAAVAHVAWVCEVHRNAWSCVQRALGGTAPAGDLHEQLYPRRFEYLAYGTGAVSELKDRTSTYLGARLGLNAVLWSLEEAGLPFPGHLSSAQDMAALCDHVAQHRAALASVTAVINDLSDREARTLRCRKGVGSNVMEFARHVLYQRQVANERLRGYDQGYVLRKRSTAKSSPWVCAPGPVAILVLVHCALSRVAGPRSVHRLAQHMAAYGIMVDHRKIDSNELGAQLRMLGLVLDSPDAESGMLLVQPFPQVRGPRGSSR